MLWVDYSGLRMLNVVILSIVMLNVVMLSAVILGVIILCVVMLTVLSQYNEIITECCYAECIYS